MNKRGPLFTIAAVALLGLILIAVNVFNGNDDNSTPEAAGNMSARISSFERPAERLVGFRRVTAAAGASVTVDGDKALAYACDGDTVESWLSGSAKDGKLDLTGQNNARMTGTLNGTDVVGVLNVGQKRWNYTVGQVRSPAGLYVEKSNGEVTAWIVDAAGSVTGVKRLADGSTTAAPDIPLRDGKLTDPSVIQVTSPDDVS